MKFFKHLFLLLFIQSFLGFSQSVCEPNQISTNPISPTNPQEPSYLNHFDWTTSSPYYNINSQCTPNTSTPNPFQSNQLELLPLSLSKDMKPEDGWEMIAYNLGYDNNNIPLAAKPEHTYLMLYNKYTGMLRILVKWCRNTNYNGALLTLNFASGFQTNLLDMANDEKPLDANHTPNPSLSTALKFYNDNNYWAYADFKLNYDPCTCAFNETSRLFLETELINNSSVQLTGKITGTISSISQGQGTASSDGKFWKSAENINNKMMSAHKSVKDFADDYQKIYKNLADGGITIGAINDIGSFLNNNDFMKAGLKALPAISGGVKFLTGLFGGGASGNQPIQLAPMSVNLDVKINGTITTQDPMHNQTIGLPGSVNNNILSGTNGGQPLYNETLGIFSLVNTPVMYYRDNETQKDFLNREKEDSFNGDIYWEIRNEYTFIERNYKFSGETLKYAINPASGLTLQDAEIILITEYEKPGLTYKKLYPNRIAGIDTNQDNGLAIYGTNTGPPIDSENEIFQNAYKPIGIYNFKNDYSFKYLYNIIPIKGERRRLQYNPFTRPNWNCYSNNFICDWSLSSTRPFNYIQSNSEQTSWNNLNPNFDFVKNSSSGLPPHNRTPKDEFLAPRVKNFKLKFVLNLKRTDNPDAQNVLYVVTYPVELKEAPNGYNMNGSDYIADALEYENQPNFNPNNPTNKIIPATQSELADICSSSKYKLNRTSSSSKFSSFNDVKKDMDIISEKPVLYPVPVKDQLTITKNNCKIVSIIDSYGKIVKEFNQNDTTSSNEEVSIDISNLNSGIYLLTYLDSENNLKSIKFIIE